MTMHQMELEVAHHSYYVECYHRIKALWLSVFIRAARDYALWKTEQAEMEKRKLAEDAKYFLFDARSGLVDLCIIFDLPIDRLRHWARELTREEVRKIEMLERSKRVDLEQLLVETNRQGLLEAE